MTTTVASEVTPYLHALESLERGDFAQDPQWARTLRKDAIATFSNLGFPTARRGNEEWKYTDVRPIARTTFNLPKTYGLPKTAEALPISDSELEVFGASFWHRLVFVDGTLNHELSDLSGLPDNVDVMDLSQALESRSDLVQEHLSHIAPYSDHAFTALNTAFLHQGAFVHVPKDTVVERPIHVLFLNGSEESHTLSQPRVLVITGRNSKATIIESHGALTGEPYLSNAVSEILVGANASLEYYRVQRHGAEGYHVGTTQAALEAGAYLSSVTFDLGGSLVRNNLNVLLDAPDSSCMLNGLYLATGSQKVDNQITIDHAKPHTTSRELYKGILGGRSRAAFHGSITVRKDAQKVDAKQEDKNLLLSDKAQVNVKPAFWVYADDVKCGHGAASGQIDENSLFYLKSRGLGEDEARSLLIHGFVSEVIQSVGCDSLRSHVNDLVTARLPKL